MKLLLFKFYPKNTHFCQNNRLYYSYCLYFIFLFSRKKDDHLLWEGLQVNYHNTGKYICIITHLEGVLAHLTSFLQALDKYIKIFPNQTF